jgi:hypothetical protein
VLYELNDQTGALINSINLGGLGAAGVSIARDIGRSSNMMLFAPSGGGDLPNATPGVLSAFWCGPNGCLTATSPGSGIGLEEVIIIAMGVLVLVLAMFVLLKRRTPKQQREPVR